MARAFRTRLKNLTAPELAYLDGLTIGTVTASKALVVDANKDLSTLRNVGLVNLDAGSSGVAGTVDIFPTTASKGKITFAATANTNDDAITITNAAHGQATALTIPDCGASTGEFVMSKGNSTIAGVKTFTGSIVGTGIGVKNVARQSADVVKDDGAAASILTGLSQTVVAGTYHYRAKIQCLSTANGGAKVTLKLTTAVLTSIQNVGKGLTAAGAGAGARTTTATDGATLYGSTEAITEIELEGTMVVSTGGTVELYAAQNASHADESTFYTGSIFEMIRIA